MLPSLGLENSTPFSRKPVWKEMHSREQFLLKKYKDDAQLCSGLGQPCRRHLACLLCGIWLRFLFVLILIFFFSFIKPRTQQTFSAELYSPKDPRTCHFKRSDHWPFALLSYAGSVARVGWSDQEECWIHLLHPGLLPLWAGNNRKQ